MEEEVAGPSELSKTWNEVQSFDVKEAVTRRWNGLTAYWNGDEEDNVRTPMTLTEQMKHSVTSRVDRLSSWWSSSRPRQ